MITGCYMTAEEVAKRIEGFMYVRDNERKPIGIVVWDKEGRIGWSLYNEDHEDEAFTDKGLLIALERAETVPDPEEDLCRRIKKMCEYRETCDTHFEDTRLHRAISVIRHIKDQARRELERQNEIRI